MRNLTLGGIALVLSLGASSMAFAFSGADSSSSNGQGFAQPSVIYAGDHRPLFEGRQVDVGPQSYALPDTVPGVASELNQLYGTSK